MLKHLAYTFLRYKLHIQEMVCMGKVFRSFRFDGALYEKFGAVCKADNFTATGALERFMQSCVDSETIVFGDASPSSYEAEARVLIDWLSKDKHFYRSKGGEEEVNIQGKLLWLLSKIRNPELQNQIETSLKHSVTPKK
jgi:hypothetical protein